MNIDKLISLFEKDLNKLIHEIENYKNEANIWRVENNIANSAGNLALHLIGNLNGFIGTELGKTNYIRNRELEFSQKNVPRTELIEKINDTIKVIRDSLSKVTNEGLKKEYSNVKFPEITTTESLLVHLATHLNYHLGQVNYHRRLIEK